MKEVKIYAVPINIANVDNDEEFKKQALKLGYVWTSMKNAENINLHGLIMKTVIE